MFSKLFRKNIQKYRSFRYRGYYAIDNGEGYFLILDRFKNLIFQWEHSNIESEAETVVLIKAAIDNYESQKGVKCYG